MEDKLNQRLMYYTKLLYAVMWYVYNVVGYFMHFKWNAYNCLNSCEIKGFISVWKIPS